MADLPEHYPYPARGSNFFGLDETLRRALAKAAPDALAAHREALTRFGAFVGDLADREAEFSDRVAPPRLEAFDRAGTLVNRVIYNPLAEEATRQVYALGAVAINYGPAPAPFLISFAMGYLLSQSSIALHCPMTMTGALAYVLDRFAPADVRDMYLAPLIRADGTALTGGTWATEIHSGSDVGGTTTRAEDHGTYVRLYGLKWFASNPAGGLALATARPEGAGPGSAGLGVYLVPSVLPDGTGNSLRLRRLKDKLGTRGLPTAEIELDGAYAVPVADPPRGFKLMMEALGFSRIHNALSGAAVMRRALLEAVSWAVRRQTFGAPLSAHPMVQDELLAVLVAQEAGFALAFEAAQAFDRAAGLDIEADDDARVWLRLATALAKYATAEDATRQARRALEIIGGSGYTEDFVTARLVRDAQVLTVWEGPANIQAQEVMRLVFGRRSGAGLFRARVRCAIDAAPAALSSLAQIVAASLADVEAALATLAADDGARLRHARRMMALMADVLAATLLLEDASRAGTDGRPAHILRLWLDERLAPPPRRGIGSGAGYTQAEVEALLGHRPMELPAAKP